MVGQLGIISPLGAEVALCCALGAYLWSAVLTHDGEVFGAWPALVGRITKRMWAHKLAYGCAKCLAGSSCLIACLCLGEGLRAVPAAGTAILIALLVGRVLER